MDKNVSNVSIMILVMVHDQKRGEYYSRHFINYCYAHRAVYEIISLPDHFAFLCKRGWVNPPLDVVDETARQWSLVRQMRCAFGRGKATRARRCYCMQIGPTLSKLRRPISDLRQSRPTPVPSFCSKEHALRPEKRLGEVDKNSRVDKYLRGENGGCLGFLISKLLTPAFEIRILCDVINMNKYLLSKRFAIAELHQGCHHR